jgi:hypothetical protein
MFRNLILFFFIIAGVSSQGTSSQTIYFNPNSFSIDYSFYLNSGGWSYMACFSEYHLGPFSGDIRFGKDFTNLPPHYRLYISYNVLLMDTAGSGYIAFEMDGRQYSTTPFYWASNYGSDNCRNIGPLGSVAYLDYRTGWSHDITHTSDNISIVWYGYGTSYSYQAWGLNSISLTWYYCLSNCKRCTDNIRCQECNTGYYLWKNDTIDICKPCPGGAASCTLDQKTGILTLNTEFNSSISSNSISGWSTSPGSGNTICCQTCGTYNSSSSTSRPKLTV